MLKNNEYNLMSTILFYLNLSKIFEFERERTMQRMENSDKFIVRGNG